MLYLLLQSWITLCALRKSSLQDFLQLQQDLDQLMKTQLPFQPRRSCAVHRHCKQDARAHTSCLETVLTAAPSRVTPR